MKEAQIIKAYEAAKERYAQIGIDTRRGTEEIAEYLPLAALLADG